MGPEKIKNEHALGGLWRFLSSLRLGVALFFALGAAAVIGTLVPQNQGLETYVEAYGRLGYALIDALGVNDIYHAGWFRFLLVMLSVNITVCSIDRLKRTWKVIFPGNRRVSFQRIEKTGTVESFVVDFPPAEASVRLAGMVNKGRGGFTVETDDGEIRMVSETGRLNRLGAHVVHLSVLLMLVGGLIGSLFGFDGSVRIPEGESRGRIRLHGGGDLPLGFDIRCDAFTVTFHEGPSGGRVPTEYRSALTILENGRETVRKEIIVNDPLRHRGIGIFQSSYGRLPPMEISLEVIRLHPRETFALDAAVGKPLDLPGGLGVFTIEEFRDHYVLGDQDIGEAFIATFTPMDRPPVNVVIPYPFPNIDPGDPMLRVLSTPTAPRPAGKVEISFTSRASGMVFERTMAIGDTCDLPENMGVFSLVEFMPSFDYMGHDMGPAYVGRLSSGDRKPEDVVLPVRFSRFDRMRQGPVTIAVSKETGAGVDTGVVARVTGYRERYYTGLQVNRDPGVPLVYAGFVLMIIGCWMTFFMPHRTLGVRIAAEGHGSRITVAGSANRNKPGIRNHVNRLAERIRKTVMKP